MDDKQQQGPLQARNDRSVLMPRVDIYEDETGITLFADLPGVPKDAVNVRVDGDTLTIDGEIRLGFPEDMQAEFAELRASAFQRSFTLSRELDPGKSESVLENGVLKLRVPKSEQAQKRKIEIKVG